MKFYYCEGCGNIIAYVKKAGCNVKCCGMEMKELILGTVDASVEKHTPVINVKGNSVEVVVGSVEHPMIDKHYIEWIVLCTKEGNQRKELKPGQAPVAKFAITEGDEVLEAYAYCNLHGLWKTSL